MEEVKEKAVVFENVKEEKLWGVLSLPPGQKKFPAVLIIHGFYGSKSQRKFVKMARKFAKNGIAVLRFDFSGCGESEGDFEKMGIKREAGELESAYKFLIKQAGIDKNRIGLLGYSLGAVIAVLFQLKSSVARTLVLASPAFDQKKLIKIWYAPADIKKWQKQGFFDTPKCRIGFQYLQEAEDFTPLAAKIKIPTLIIHGGKDEDVPLEFGEKLLKSLSCEKKTLRIIKEANHDFESRQTSNGLINYSLNWFKKCL